MPNLVPGFTWQPIEVNGRAARRKGRGLIGHVAVSGAANLPPSGPSATRGADWHFYLPKTGPGFQYIDLDLQCWASLSGNASMAAFESQGGLGATAQVNAEPWTADQVENAARILAYLNETEGVPLQDMGNSLPTSRGLGVHRYGIDPWRVAGGEMWSNPGKLCPGDAKVAQIPVIVSRAVEIRGGSPAPTPAPPVANTYPLRLTWPFGKGQYVGDIKGPANCHGGYYASERPAVRMIQQRLQKLGYAPKASAWADGRYEKPTAAAVQKWQRAKKRHVTGRITAADWKALI